MAQRSTRNHQQLCYIQYINCKHVVCKSGLLLFTHKEPMVIYGRWITNKACNLLIFCKGDGVFSEPKKSQKRTNFEVLKGKSQQNKIITSTYAVHSWYQMSTKCTLSFMYPTNQLQFEIATNDSVHSWVSNCQTTHNHHQPSWKVQFSSRRIGSLEERFLWERFPVPAELRTRSWPVWSGSSLGHSWQLGSKTVGCESH